MCFFLFFLPGAVLTVDAAPEGQLAVVEVVLRLLRDAPFFPHGVRHLVLHLRCRNAREQSSLAKTSERSFRGLIKRSEGSFLFQRSRRWCLGPACF